MPHLPAAQRFYGGLFGWEWDEAGAGSGFAASAHLRGRAAAGIAQAAVRPGVPARWSTYLAVEDVTATVDRAALAGGQVLLAPTAVVELGRVAVLADPTGAVVGLWQSGAHHGAAVVNEPGALRWNEVMTRHVPAAQAFYATLFGYTFGDLSRGGMYYATLDLAGRPVGGIGELPAGTPRHVAAGWHTCFGVEDVPATVARAVELGGTLVGGPMPTVFGLAAGIRGPFGETFSVMSPPAPAASETSAPAPAPAG